MASKSARKNLTEAGRIAERKAVAGWHELADALDGAADRTKDVAGDARTRVRRFQRKATQRTGAAKDALAGRPPRGRGRLASIATVIGIGIGAAATFVARRLVEMRSRARIVDLDARVTESAVGMPADEPTPITPPAPTPTPTPATSAPAPAPAPQSATADPGAIESTPDGLNGRPMKTKPADSPKR